MDSVDFKEAKEWAKAYDGRLNAYDPRFNGGVILSLDTGQQVAAPDAFAVTHKIHGHDWLFVFVKYHDPFVCAWADVLYLAYFEKRIAVEVVE